jgi:hypothetical protein
MSPISLQFANIRSSERERGRIEIQLKGWAKVSWIPNGPLHCFSRSNVQLMLKVFFDSNAAHVSLKQIEESTDQWIQLYVIQLP